MVRRHPGPEREELRGNATRTAKVTITYDRRETCVDWATPTGTAASKGLDDEIDCIPHWKPIFYVPYHIYIVI